MNMAADNERISGRFLHENFAGREHFAGVLFKWRKFRIQRQNVPLCPFALLFPFHLDKVDVNIHGH
jgi:hypothetical protein